jgi:hypothetical protein
VLGGKVLPSAIVSESQHLPEEAAPLRRDRLTSPAMDRCAKYGGGRCLVGQPRGRGPLLRRVRFPSIK